MVFIDEKAFTINDLISSVVAIETELGLTPSGVYATVRTRLDILEARINNPFAPSPTVTNPFIIGNDGVTISAGLGFPTENRVPGSIYLREDGYTNEGLYTVRPDGYWHLIDTTPFLAAGDLSGTNELQTVIGLQNIPLSSTAPTDGQAIIYNNTLSQWMPSNLAVIFDPIDTGTTSIRSNRGLTQSPIDNTKTGIVNLSSRSTGATTGVTGDYSAILSGDQNQVSGNYSVVNGGLLNNITGDNSLIIGSYGNSIYNGQLIQSAHAINGTAGSSQFSRVILDGTGAAGAQFNLTIAGTSNNLTLEDDKSYDMCIRILIANSSGTPVCARYVYDVLAQQITGVLSLVNINNTISNDDGTGWTISITTTAGNQLVVSIDSSGILDRRAIATVEWREISRA